MINLMVNGQEQQCKLETLLPDLLLQLNMNPQLVAIEYNGEILHRQFWSGRVVEEGDVLEVVTIVGGG
jgi:sulfur carrier protein